MKWILGICVVAVITGIAATLAVPAQTITPDEAILKLFPADTTAVASFDVASLKNSALVQGMIQQQGIPPAAKEFIDATGFDPTRDVDKATVGFGGNNHLLAIVQAHADRFKIEQYLRDHNASSETYLGRTIYSAPAPVTT